MKPLQEILLEKLSSSDFNIIKKALKSQDHVKFEPIQAASVDDIIVGIDKDGIVYQNPDDDRDTKIVPFDKAPVEDIKIIISLL